MTTLLECAARTAGSPDVLTEILDKNCNLAIWRRPEITGTEALLDGDPADIRFTASLLTVEQHVRRELVSSGFVAHPALDELVSDIAQLANRFCSILKLKECEVRLEVVETDSCRKFHADYVSARLITTYVGAGTQWLNADDAARVMLQREPKNVQSLAAGDVGLFKGKLATDRPAIHRSPPIGGTGERRLLLVLNPPEAI